MPLGVPAPAGIATVTEPIPAVFGEGALFILSVYATGLPGVAVVGLIFAVYTTTTVIGGLVEDGLVLSVTSEVVMVVVVPAVLSVTLNTRVPADNGASAGNSAFASVEAIWTVSVELTTFQNVSTALTVTLNALFTNSVNGVPV